MSVAPTGAVERLDELDRIAADAGIELVAGAPLAPYTTLRLGGPADRLATPRSRGELLAALAAGREAAVPIFVLGNGSDLVIADAGVRGLVIRNRARGLEVDGTSVLADGGVAMAQLVKRCTAASLAGVEFGISIPGSLGGAVWANAGAHGGEMADVVARVEAWNPGDGAVHQLAGADCRFGYRDSRFKETAEVVVGVELALHAGDGRAIAAAVDAHQAQRRATQPLADQNAGSVFRNPDGDHAGRLIDAAGLKGFRIGSASVSTLHANFIVADRGGRAVDVRAVGEHVRALIAERDGIRLEYEIEFVGDWTDAVVPT